MATKHAVIASLLLPFAALGAGQHSGGHGGAGTATGEPGQMTNVDRHIVVKMDDRMRFEPSSIEVKAGETVRFRVSNTGNQPHEMVIGSIEDLKAHAEEMREHPGMAHDEPNMIQLDAGESGDLVWRFTQPGQVEFACLLPGHLEAGMKGHIDVAPGQ
ncbi:cupredoxin family protein [Guyparkeria hydrothermalis]|uniref:Copper-binding protein n=1 Tax=Guyparkeria halophila TaxID=47960 RepID=A0A6I6CXL6_9GAMM|nr:MULTISPECIES: cupredoxin family protein [Guyparkeria]MCL7750331.1 cupredoxin family protein [Guyparkeria hydrothermalis]QGT78929.1 copper-binding protein [Guyparkeria halophila]